MASNSSKETNACIFHWKIENASQCWWLNVDERLESPTFIADGLMSTKWSLWLYLKGYRNKTHISLYLYRAADCSGPGVIEVVFHLAFLFKDGSLLVEKIMSKSKFLKNQCDGVNSFERPERVFVTEKDAFLPEDTLTVQCTLKKAGETMIISNYLYGRTSAKVNRKSFSWKINACSTLEAGARYEFKDTLFDFHLILYEYDRLVLKMISSPVGVKHLSFIVHVLESEGKRKYCGFKNYSSSDLKSGKLVVMDFQEKLLEDKSRYLPNDLLTLHIEFVFSTIEDFGYGKNFYNSKNDALKTKEYHIREGKSQNALLLIQDVNSLYNDGILTDTELRTSTKTFPVHKAILAVRSPVFRRMFSSDMKEANNGHVDIIDYEEDTVHRMLLYIYAGTLEDLHFESASELYKIADKYQIISMKSSCSTFLKDSMCLTKVCDILILADLYQDIDLKNAAEDYIMEHNDVFNSLEWKNFMDSNLKLAADIMYKKVNTVRICKGTM